jgi:hypothetical protein
LISWIDVVLDDLKAAWIEQDFASCEVSRRFQREKSGSCCSRQRGADDDKLNVTTDGMQYLAQVGHAGRDVARSRAKVEPISDVDNHGIPAH